MGLSIELLVSVVYMLLGNDLASDQVVPGIDIIEDPIMDEQRNVLNSEICDNKERNEESAMYSRCVIHAYQSQEDGERYGLNLDSLF